jgi:hypothetical protein
MPSRAKMDLVGLAVQSGADLPVACDAGSGERMITQPPQIALDFEAV